MSKTKLAQFDDSKLVLRASQALEELRRVTSESIINAEQNDTGDNNMYFHLKISHSNFQDLLLLQTRLEDLLLQRYTLNLKAEHSKAVSRTENLYRECWLVVESEKQKLKAVPATGYNASADGHFFDLLSCKMFPEKLSNVEQMWCGIRGSFQRAVHLFSTGFNYDLAHVYHYSSLRSSQLLGQLTLLVSIFLNVCLEKLCCIDPGSLSPDFVSSVMVTCQSFSEHYEKSEVAFRSSRCCVDGRSDFRLNWEHMMSLLARSQASVAADRIVCSLIPVARKMTKQSNEVFKITWCPHQAVKGTDSEEQATSDYASASCSDQPAFYDVSCGTPGAKATWEVDPVFSSALTSIVQKNQALLLKYIFAVKNSCVKSESAPSDANENVLQATWNGTRSNIATQTGSLEKLYWSSFWRQTEIFIFEMLLEAPLHHHGNILPGSLMMWNEGFLVAFMRVLRSSCEIEDMTPDGQKCLKKIFLSILAFISCGAWDKSFHLAAKHAGLSRCNPVPTADGNLVTKPGLLFCDAIKPMLTVIVSYNWHCGNLIDLFKAMNGLLVTAEAFRNWVLLKERLLLSSMNLSAYMIIAHSDVIKVQNIVKDAFLSEFVASFLRWMPSHLEPILSIAWNHLQNSLKEIKAVNEELPILVQRKVSKLLLQNYFARKQRFRFCICCNEEESSRAYGSISYLVDYVLNPMYETIISMEVGNNYNRRILNTVIMTIVETLLDLLEMKSKPSRFRSLLSDTRKFLKWFENLPITPEDRCKLLTSRCRERVVTLKIILDATESFLKRRKRARTNQVVPHPSIQ